MFKSIKYLLLGGALLIASCSSDDQSCGSVFTSISTNAYSNDSWMNELLLAFPESDFGLSDICIPRSHDAGMYITQQCTIGANACNVSTQDLNMGEQLSVGIRNFDVRPQLKNGVYFTRHSLDCDGLGCLGDRVENIMQQLRDFLDDHAELVLIELHFFCDTGGDDIGLTSLIENILGDRLYKESIDYPTPFIDRPLKDIIPSSSQSGKAMMIYSGVSNSLANRTQGIFSPLYVPRTGSYSNAQNFEDMMVDQFEKYTNYSNDGTALYEIPWTLTQDAEQAVSCILPGESYSIRRLAGEVNPRLAPSMEELANSCLITTGRIPNVISVDFCEDFVTRQCIQISLLSLQDE